MDAAVFNDYLENRYYDQLRFYEKRSGKNQGRYKNFQWILIIFSTLTTILAALPKSEHFDLQYYVVGSAALVTILTSALRTFQYHELWVSYRNTIEQLKPEIYYYRFNVGDYGNAGIDKETLFVRRVEGILSKEHDTWPVYKKLTSGEGNDGQANEDQKKLDALAREKFDTVKKDPVSDETQTQPPADENVSIPETTETETKQDTVPDENVDKNEETGDDNTNDEDPEKNKNSGSP